MASCQGYNSKIDDLKDCKDKALVPGRPAPTPARVEVWGRTSRCSKMEAMLFTKLNNNNKNEYKYSKHY